MSKKETVFYGQHLYTADRELFFVFASELKMHNKMSFIQEFVVTCETLRLVLEPVPYTQKRTFKAFRVTREQVEEHLLCVSVGNKIVRHAPGFTTEAWMVCGRLVCKINGTPYYRSTGQSNASGNNFPHVWFPWKGLAINGWFVKCSDPTAEWKTQFPEHQAFLDRFETYEQLRVSAWLNTSTKSYWFQHRKFHRFVLKHNEHLEQEGVPCYPKPFRFASHKIGILYRDSIFQVNEWLQTM